MILIFGSLLVSAVAMVWVSVSEKKATPQERLATALKLIDDSENRRSWIVADRIAQDLDKLNYRHPEFGGATEFIQGISAYREAQIAQGLPSERLYREAVKFLKQSELQALTETRVTEWQGALGWSLFSLGKYVEAEPYLTEVINSSDDSDVVEPRLIRALIELRLSYGHRRPDNETLMLGRRLVELTSDDTEEHDAALLLLSRLQFAANLRVEAKESLAKVSKDNSSAVAIESARLDMAEGDYQSALEKLIPIAEEISLEQTFVRQANYLAGLAQSAFGDQDAAISILDRGATQFPETEEGIASALTVARFLQEAGRNEEALTWFRTGLGWVGRTEDFRNRWLSLDTVRSILRDSWEFWINKEDYEDAIALAMVSSGVMGDLTGHELVARAHRQAAESAEDHAAQLPASEQAATIPARRHRWQQSGRAYRTYANILTDHESQATALWMSAEDFRKAGEFEQAYSILSKFLELDPEGLTASGLLARGEILMDLDRFEDASVDFLKIMENFRTDPVYFAARLMYGQCLVEQEKLDEAEQVWQNLLTSDNLTPDAAEWRSSLFSLGRLLHRRGEILAAAEFRSDQPTQDEQTPGQADSVQAAMKRQADTWDRAVSALREFLLRYPKDERISEARVLGATALRKRAALARKRLMTAETDNLRTELKRQSKQLLEEAAQEMETVKRNLIPVEDRDQLSAHGRELVRTATFELGHMYSEAGLTQEAIDAYTSATNRYPDDPRVLLCFIRMADAYRAQKQELNARSVLEQAKVVLKRMPEESFDPARTTLSRVEWENWLARAAVGSERL
ncbi:Tetratricopeptide repeat protein [Calycomorphotria hydatis]|uniref:Tetratricopeptide repeat protein n=2 Tax=Calycomorphotria hydatis TaxID=2528027 RepID=A0A517TBB7_9PLAN|nr:Tetratricopeptide repeat protein [Calycomorphotria hydatis]